MNERSVVSFSLRKLSRDNSHATYFNSRLITCLVYQAKALLAQLFNIRNANAPTTKGTLFDAQMTIKRIA